MMLRHFSIATCRILLKCSTLSHASLSSRIHARRQIFSGVKLGDDDVGLDVAVIQKDVKHEQGVRDFVSLRPCEESEFAEAANSAPRSLELHGGS